MSPTFTIIVPTHDHAPLLPHSIGSALAQTEDDLEVVVIGDGVGDDTRDVVADLTRDDPRVRFVDRPKSPRTGERYRHEVLGECDSTYVTYLSDDDLLFPNHLAATRDALSSCEVVHAFGLHVDGAGALRAELVDLSHPVLRQRQLDGTSHVSLTGLGHSMATYRSLPHGWRDTPAEFYTDQFMYLQLMEDPKRRIAALPVPTCLKLPAVMRRNQTNEVRVGELAEWAAVVGSPSRLLEAIGPVVSSLFHDAVWQTLQAAAATNELQLQAERLWGESRVALSEERHRADVSIAALRDELDAVRRDATAQTAAAEWYRQQIEVISQTKTWRLRDRLVRLARRGTG